MKKIVMLMAFMFCATLSFAQNESLEKINKIKKNNSYLYGESTMPTKEEASSVAMEILQQDIRQWAVSHSKKKVEKVVATDVSNIVDSIVTKRVNMFRVFLYVKKSKLIPIFHDEGLVIVDPDAEDKSDLKESEDTVSKAEVVVEKNKSASKKQPVKKNKEKKKKKDKKKTPDYLSGVTVDKSAVDKQNKETTGVMQDEKPNANDSISEEEIDTLDVSESGKTDSVEVDSNDEEEVTDEAVIPALQKIKALKSFTELRGTLVPLKEQGEITAFGKYATMQEPEKSYLIIYDPNGRIRAILGKGDKTRKNLNTGKEDGIKNYRGCGAIWFQLNDK